MAEEGAKSGGALRGVVLWLVVLALFGAVLWLASERNERHWRVAITAVTDDKTHDHELRIERGRFFPLGTAPSADKVYAKIDVPPGEKAPSEIEFDDQNALDRWLFDVLISWAKSVAKKGDTHSAASLADRASHLPGLTGEQNAELTSLRTELAWDEAETDVGQALQMLDAAVRDLQSVAAGKGPRALDAQKESERLRGIRQSLKPAK